jgi:anti-anti-sigma regulatory factor
MKIKREDRGPVTILHLHGTLTGGPDADRYDQAMEELIRESRSLCVLDFAHVSFLSSPAIGYIFRNYAHYLHADGRQVVAHMSSRVSLVYDAFFRGAFHYFDTVDEAAEYLNKPEIVERT